jgi:hypothetical protein
VLGEKCSPSWKNSDVTITRPREAGEEREPDEQPGRVRAVAQQARRDHRRAVRAALGDGEDADEREAGGHQAERPQRPAELAALDEGIDEAQRSGADQDDAERVEPRCGSPSATPA